MQTKSTRKDAFLIRKAINGMKTTRNIFIAFILNLFFSIFEFVGGILTGSVAIISDSIHDAGDAASIGIAFFLEKKSKKQPDEKYTYGYARYSVVGSVITTLILLFGSAWVIYNAIGRIISPTEIDYNGMIVFALIGATVNLIAAFVTKDGDSLNQRAVNLHMLEDVLGWIVVLIGAIVMRFSNITVLDPIMSIGVAIFIIVNAIRNLKDSLDLFLEKAPGEINVSEIKEHLEEINGVIEVHHIHVWSLDGQLHYATLHAVTAENAHDIKHKIREELKEHGINHVTIELEFDGEPCHETNCRVELDSHTEHHHHHHNHHHHHEH